MNEVEWITQYRQTVHITVGDVRVHTCGVELFVAHDYDGYTVQHWVRLLSDGKLA